MTDLILFEKDCKEIFGGKFMRFGDSLQGILYVSIQGNVTTIDTVMLKKKNIEIIGVEATASQSLIIFLMRGK